MRLNFPERADQPLPPHLPAGYRTTLRHLLTHELDISSVPNYSFFEWLAHFCEGDMQERLREFASPAGYVRPNLPFTPAMCVLNS